MIFSLCQAYGERDDPVSGQEIFFPALRVTFRYKKCKLTIGNALVDTGADETLLPLSMAVEMGFKFDLDEDKTLREGAGGKQFVVYKSPVKIDCILESQGFRPFIWQSSVFFTLEQPTILIGRNNFLDKFTVTFRGKEKILELSA